MRQIATMPRKQAEVLADHLFTLRVETQLEPLDEGVALWVCDEDKVDLARQELEAFNRDPGAGRYSNARRQATALRRQADSLEEDYQARTERLRERMETPSGAKRPVTVALIAASVLIYMSAAPGNMHARGYDPGKVYDALFINSPATAYNGYLADIQAGQVWRLFTPALLHFGLDHIVMNSLAILYLAGAIENRRGSLRLAILVLFLALASNVPQYFLGRAAWDGHVWHFPPNWSFGGLSGVAYGLFGWIWIKSHRDPELGFFMAPSTVGMVMVWFVLCWGGVFGPIANVAHTAGLLAGMGLGFLPRLGNDEPPTKEQAP